MSVNVVDSASEAIEFMDEITKVLTKGLKSSTVDMLKIMTVYNG